MGRVRDKSGRRRSNEALIKVTGAPSILPVAFTAIARTDQTWYDFLAKNGLKLTPKHGIHVRTVHRKDANGRPGFGGELKEKVGTFLEKYPYKNREKFAVRLLRMKTVVNFKPPQPAPSPPGNAGGQQQSRMTRTTGGSRVGESEEVVWNQRRAVEAGGQMQIVTREAQLAIKQFGETADAGEEEGRANNQLVLQAVKLEIEEEEEATINLFEASDGEDEALVQQLEEDEEEDYDDSMSVITSASQEAMELRRRGIQGEDLKNPARRRFEEFENSFLLRARLEVKKLKDAKVWVRNYQRAPLACYLLEQILQP